MYKLLPSVSITLLTIILSCKENTVPKAPESQSSAYIRTIEHPRIYNRTMYISAEGGLRMRDKPSTEGNKIVTIPDNSEVWVIEETGDQITISGKTGKWAKVRYKEDTGWVFGGFLKITGSQTNKSQNKVEYETGTYCFFIDRTEPPNKPFPSPWMVKIIFNNKKAIKWTFNFGEGFEDYDCSHYVNDDEVYIHSCPNQTEEFILEKIGINELKLKESNKENFYYGLTKEYFGRLCPK